MKISIIKKLLRNKTKIGKNLDFHIKARAKLLKSSQLVNRAAKSTLGPLGRNCLIEYELGVPRLTKDGVTVIKNLKTNDPIINIGINLFKNISHNANKYCGDNTTSSTIIGTEIFNEGIKYLESGGNPIIMKKGIEKAKEIVIDYLENIKEDIIYQNKKEFSNKIVNVNLNKNIYYSNKKMNENDTKENSNKNNDTNLKNNNEIFVENENEIFDEKNKIILKKIALIATNYNENISNLLVDYFSNLGPQGVHMLEMSGVLDNEILFLEGGSYMRGYANSGFVKDKKKNGEHLTMENPFVVILNYEINDLSFILEILERVNKLKRPLLILCKEMKDNLISQLVFNFQKQVFDVCVVEFPNLDKENFLIEDLSVIFNAFIFDEFTVTSGFHEFEIGELGEAKEITINEYETNFVTSENKTEEHKEKIKNQLKKIEQELEGGKLKSF